MYTNSNRKNMLKKLIINNNNNKEQGGSQIVVLMLYLVLPALLGRNSKSPASGNSFTWNRMEFSHMSSLVSDGWRGSLGYMDT